MGNADSYVFAAKNTGAKSLMTNNIFHLLKKDTRKTKTKNLES